MTRNIITTIMLVSFLCNQPIFAQDATPKTELQEPEEEQTQTPMQEIGLEEAPAPRPKNDSNLKNWLFAAGSIISASVAIVVVSWCQGSPPPNSVPNG